MRLSKSEQAALYALVRFGGDLSAGGAYLGIKPIALQSRLGRLRTKLDCSNRVCLVRWALSEALKIDGAIVWTEQIGMRRLARPDKRRKYSKRMTPQRVAFLLRRSPT